MQALLFNPEIVSNLVHQRPPHVLFESLDVGCLFCVRLGIDEDAIRQSHVIVTAALSERDALVIAKQRLATAKARLAALFACRAGQDDNLEVVEPIVNLVGKLVINLADETLEAPQVQVLSAFPDGVVALAADRVVDLATLEEQELVERGVG